MKNVFYVLVVSCLLLGCNTKKAEQFPNRPINLYVGYQPGGGTDMAARALASLATECLGQPVIVVNMPGASGALAANRVATSKPDGYTLLVAGGSETVSVGHYKKLPYQPMNSFSPVIRITVEKIVVSVNSRAKYKTLDEFISEAKKRPGKLTYSSSGHFGIFHSAALAFCREAGIVMKHVPYNGDAAIVAALMGNHVDLAFTSQVAAIPLFDGGQINCLAQCSMDKRSALLPDVPTMKELGYNISIENQKGIVAPANTPEDRIMLLHDCFKKVIETPEFIDRANKLQLEVAYLNPQDFKVSLKYIYDQIGLMLK